MKIQIMGGKVCLRCKDKTLLGVVNKLSTQQCVALLPQVNFPANDLNFYWNWRWWDRIQAIFSNLFYNCFIITASTTTDSGTANITSNCENRPVSGINNSSSMLEIPMKEIIIVTMMLSLWVYSILLTKRRWKQILRDWWLLENNCVKIGDLIINANINN